VICDCELFARTHPDIAADAYCPNGAYIESPPADVWRISIKYDKKQSNSIEATAVHGGGGMG
jgi:hypothetical protein